MATRTLAQLETERDEILTAMSDCRKAGQNYTRPGLSMGRVLYKDLEAALKRVESQIRKMGATGISSVMDASGGGTPTEASEWGGAV